MVSGHCVMHCLPEPLDDGTRVVLEAHPQDPLGGDGTGIRLGWRPDDTIVLTR